MAEDDPQLVEARWGDNETPYWVTHPPMENSPAETQIAIRVDHYDGLVRVWSNRDDIPAVRQILKSAVQGLGLAADEIGERP